MLQDIPECSMFQISYRRSELLRFEFSVNTANLLVALPLYAENLR